MPPLALPAREYMERARAIWDELGLPPLTPQPPWHGYSLGDWDAAWESYARARGRRAQWAESGDETSRAAAAGSRRRRRCGR